MNKNELIEEAKSLPHVTGDVQKEFSLKRDLLVKKVDKIIDEYDDMENIVGQENLEMMRGNNTNHAQYMESIFRHYDAGHFVDTISWVFNTYLSHGFKQHYWNIHFQSWKKGLKSEMSDDACKQIIPYYNWMEKRIPEFIEITGK